MRLTLLGVSCTGPYSRFETGIQSRGLPASSCIGGESCVCATVPQGMHIRTKHTSDVRNHRIAMRKAFKSDSPYQEIIAIAFSHRKKTPHRPSQCTSSVLYRTKMDTSRY